MPSKKNISSAGIALFRFPCAYYSYAGGSHILNRTPNMCSYLRWWKGAPGEHHLRPLIFSEIPSPYYSSTGSAAFLDLMVLLVRSCLRYDTEWDIFLVILLPRPVVALASLTLSSSRSISILLGLDGTAVIVSFASSGCGGWLFKERVDVVLLKRADGELTTEFDEAEKDMFLLPMFFDVWFILGTGCPASLSFFSNCSPYALRCL